MNEQDLVSAPKGRLESLFPSERELVSNVNIRVKWRIYFMAKVNEQEDRKTKGQ